MSRVVVLFDFVVSIVHERSIVWLIQPLEKLFRNPVLLLKISFVGDLKLASKYINFLIAEYNVTFECFGKSRDTAVSS